MLHKAIRKSFGIWSQTCARENPTMKSTITAPAALEEQRDLLEKLESELLLALLSGADPPSGLSAGKVREAGGSLLNKRKRIIERSCPNLLAEMGQTGFDRSFARYSQVYRGLPEDGICRDVRRFCHFVRKDQYEQKPLWFGLALERLACCFEKCACPALRRAAEWLLIPVLQLYS